MTNQQICDFYDANPDLTLADIDAIVDRIGFERFAAVLANPKPF